MIKCFPSRYRFLNLSISRYWVYTDTVSSILTTYSTYWRVLLWWQKFIAGSLTVDKRFTFLIYNLPVFKTCTCVLVDTRYCIMGSIGGISDSGIVNNSWFCEMLSRKGSTFVFSLYLSSLWYRWHWQPSSVVWATRHLGNDEDVILQSILTRQKNQRWLKIPLLKSVSNICLPQITSRPSWLEAGGAILDTCYE